MTRDRQGDDPGVRRLCAVALCATALLACAAPTEKAEPYASWPEPLEYLPRGLAQTMRLCGRAGDDLVRDLFCGAAAPKITSLIDLQTALAIDASHIGGMTGLSVTSDSTALSARSVSAINPRVIAVRVDVPPVELLALAFARGEQFSELVVRDRADKELRFYLIGFRQACNDAAGGCTPGDLLTPAVERDWTEVTPYAEEDLENTVLDCRPCHQPAGPGTAKLLRMQEIANPWTHWFFRSSEGGRALLADYLAAKGDETLAGMPAKLIEASHPGDLSTVVKYDGFTQPNQFDGADIEREVVTSAAERGGAQPDDNTVSGQSATWRQIYERSLRGEAMPVPYHDVKVTDPDKLARMTRAYQAYRRGEIRRDELPDVRDVFPDDETRLAEMGFRTEPGLSGEAVLVQACSLCHNTRLNQNLSRARFVPDLSALNRAEKDTAIARLKLSQDDPRAMPPRRLRLLSRAAREAAIKALRQ